MDLRNNLLARVGVSSLHSMKGSPMLGDRAVALVCWFVAGVAVAEFVLGWVG